MLPLPVFLPAVFPAAFVALLSTAPPLVSSQALHEQDLIYYGAWDQISPVSYNRRLGLNASVFQIAQDMPIPPYNYTSGAGGPAPEYMIENTSTNAAVFLTVYPSGLTNLVADDFTALGNQVLAYKSDFNRSVFIRWAPEMQGLWNPYGQQPVQFVATWKTMYTAVKSIAPDAAIVWAPNLGNGYPYGQTTNDPATLTALDTNHDGQLDNGDDPYTPYYPGDDYVDWIGLSVYYKENGVNTNMAQQAGFCSDVFSGISTSDSGQASFNWYTMFCNKPGKACLVAESGAAYHPNDNQGTASALDIQRAWWQDCITNTTLMNTYPRIKLHMHFEFEKLETDGNVADLRDYRLTNDTAMLAAYQQDLLQVQSRYAWATYKPLASPVQSSGPGVSAPATATQFATPSLVLQTVRNPLVTAPPSLFGETLSSGAVRATIPWFAALAVAAMGGATVVGRRSA